MYTIVIVAGEEPPGLQGHHAAEGHAKQQITTANTPRHTQTQITQHSIVHGNIEET